LKEGSFWIQGSKIQPSNSKNIYFCKHLKEGVAIAYFQLPVNRKKEKWREFFRMYLHYGASYAPETGGVWMKGHPGCRVRKFSVLKQKSFFGKQLKTVTEPAPNFGANWRGRGHFLKIC
jgi:hypothetical protein